MQVVSGPIGKQTVHVEAPPRQGLEADRDDYCRVLEGTQRNGLDVTAWSTWFLVTLRQAMQTALEQIRHVLLKARF